MDRIQFYSSIDDLKSDRTPRVYTDEEKSRMAESMESLSFTKVSQQKAINDQRTR